MSRSTTSYPVTTKSTWAISHEDASNISNVQIGKKYDLPQNYNPEDHPPVKLRNKNNYSDQSETQRKRRSKNRLSNRRSTGYIPQETVEEALRMEANKEKEQF